MTWAGGQPKQNHFSLKKKNKTKHKICANIIMRISYGIPEIVFLWSLGTDFWEFQKCTSKALQRQGHLPEEETAVHEKPSVLSQMWRACLNNCHSTLLISHTSCLDFPDQLLAGQNKPREQICGLCGLRVFPRLSTFYSSLESLNDSRVFADWDFAFNQLTLLGEVRANIYSYQIGYWVTGSKRWSQPNLP